MKKSGLNLNRYQKSRDPPGLGAVCFRKIIHFIFALLYWIKRASLYPVQESKNIKSGIFIVNFSSQEHSTPVNRRFHRCPKQIHGPNKSLEVPFVRGIARAFRSPAACYS